MHCCSAKHSGAHYVRYCCDVQLVYDLNCHGKYVGPGVTLFGSMAATNTHRFDTLLHYVNHPGILCHTDNIANKPMLLDNACFT